MPIEKIETVNGDNQARLEDCNDRLREWEAKPKNNQGPKPKRPSTISVKIGYFCYKTNYLNRSDGGQWYVCHEIATTVGNDGSHLVYNEEKSSIQCQCEICSCPCQVTFPQHNRAKIAFSEKQKSCDGNFENYTSAGYFHKTLMDCLFNGAITASHESGTKEEISTNGASYGALDILTNPLLQQNVGLYKFLQSAIKPPSARKMKEIRRGVGPMVKREVSPTPCLSLAAMCNFRFYRNNLRTLACQPIKSSQVIELLEDSGEKKEPCLT